MNVPFIPMDTTWPLQRVQQTPIARRPCPALTEDEWAKIASYLSPSDLSSLSQVSTTCFLAATRPQLFRARYMQAVNGETPPFTITDNLPWAAIYRRHCAIRYPPESFELMRCINGPAKIVASLGDCIVLLDVNRKCLVGFPQRWRASLNDLHVEPANVKEACIELRGGRLGVLGSRPVGLRPGRARRAVFSVIDVNEGLLRHATDIPWRPTVTFRHVTVDPPKLAALGGAHGQYLLYYIGRRELCVVSLADFEHLTTVVMDTADILVFGATPNIGSVVVRGIARTCRIDGKLDVEVRTLFQADVILRFRCNSRFDGPIHSIRASADGRTFVLTRVGANTVVVRFPNADYSSTNALEWEIDRDGYASVDFEVRGNGNVIAPRVYNQLRTPPTGLVGFPWHSIYYFFDGEGSWKDVETLGTDEFGDRWDVYHTNTWHRMSEHGGFALSHRLLQDGDPSVALWEVERKTLPSGFRVCNRRRLAYWPEIPFVEFTFVGDHVAVGLMRDGHVATFHFGAFCTKSKGSKWTLVECVHPFKKG